MKKILTFHYPENYGAFLQCFALQSKLNASVVDFVPGWSFFIGKKARKIPVIGFILGCVRRHFAQAGFSEKKFLNLKKFDKKDSDGIYIAGSDQIWNPRCIGNLYDVYFLSFLSDSVKRISYAASLGMKQWPKDFESKVLPSLKKFSAVSVREESSVTYLSSLGLENVVCVCDPTILYDGEFYRKSFNLEKKNHPVPFVYRIRENIPEAVLCIICRSSEQRHVVDLNDKSTVCSVTEWLSNIDNASFVITDSFHCAVFCILFHKPFVVLANHGSGKGMNERFETLLGKTGLLYRVLTQEMTTGCVLELLQKPVDWMKVDIIMEEWRSYSANWLKEAIKNYCRR